MRAKSELKPFMHLVRKNITWMKKILQEFTKPVRLVVHACSGAFCATKACMILSKHRKSIALEVDQSCVTEPILELILLHALPVLRKESDIDKEGLLRSSAEVYIEAVQANKVRMGLHMSAVSKGLCPMQTFLPDILYRLSTNIGRKKQF